MNFCTSPRLTRAASRAKALGATALLLASALAAGQGFPSKPIQIIVPFHPAGSTSVVLRHMAPLLSERLGQQVIVVNKPGGGGSIGMAAVASAAPDGYTLGVATLAFAANPGMLDSKPPFDVHSSFTPIALVARIALVLTVNPALGIQSMQDLVRTAKEKPGTLNYGSAGIASSGHLGGALFESAAGVQMVHIPFGTVGSGTAVASGDVQLQIGPIPSSLPLIKAGKMRALGVSSLKPAPSLPGVQTLASQGLPGFEAYDWSGIMAPAHTPPAIVQRLRDEIAFVLQDPAVRRRIEDTGSEVLGGTPAEFQSFLTQEVDKWTKVAAHIKAAEAMRK